MAALIRDQGDRGRAARKVSLRSSGGEVDVSAIARKHGGGGHKRAAGFSTDLELDELVSLPLRRSHRPARPLSMAGERRGRGSALRQAGRDNLARHGRAGAARAAAARRGTPAPSTPSPPACCWSCSGGATRLQRFLTGLPKTYRATAAARLALEHRRPRRRADRDRARCRTRWSCRPGGAPAGADDLGRAGRRRAALPQGPPRRGGRRRPSATSTSTGPSCSAATPRAPTTRSSARRGPTSAPWSRPSSDAYCAELRRTAIGPFRVEDAGEELSLDRGRRRWSPRPRRPCDDLPVRLLPAIPR